MQKGIVGKLALLPQPEDAPPVACAKSKAVPQISLRGAVETSGPINLANVRRAVESIDKRKGFFFSIQSDGGNIKEALRVYSYLRSLPIPISARVDGYCFSSAMLIFLAADHRVAGIDDALLIHASRQPRESLQQEFYIASDLRKIADGLDQSDDECNTLMSDRTGCPPEWFAANGVNEDCLSPSEALESGLVHELAGVAPHCTVEWAEYARSLARMRGVYIDRRYLTSNYFQACVVADRLRAAGR